MTEASNLYVKNLSKIYKTKSYEVKALNNISFEVGNHEFIGLIGPSGSGKTTLINCLSGLVEPTEGSIVINGIDLLKLSKDDRNNFRLENIGMVFQEHLLIESLTTLENIEMPMVFFNIPEDERKSKAIDLLKEFDLLNKELNLPSELSGGEQQRVGIARALIMNPKILFADEPTGNLDSKTGFKIIQLFKEIAHTKNLSVIMVSHDPRHVRHFDRVLQLKDGSIENPS